MPRVRRHGRRGRERAHDGDLGNAEGFHHDTLLTGSTQRIDDAPRAAWPRRRLPDVRILDKAPARGADRRMTNSKSATDAAPHAQITTS
jgi:hypothetical protein